MAANKIFVRYWTTGGQCSSFVLSQERKMPAIETLGEAYQASWGIRMKCHRGIVKMERCAFECALDMQTLVCTVGAISR